MATKLDPEFVKQVLIKGPTTNDFVTMIREVDRLEKQVDQLESKLQQSLSLEKEG